MGYYSPNTIYKASATGSVTRLIATKLQDTICVKDFGALGDGSTDDTAAFNAAHTAAALTGQVVYVPGATYKLASTVTIKAPMVGDGYNTILSTSSATADVLSITSINGVRLAGFQITASVTRTAGVYIAASAAQYLILDQLFLINWFSGISLTGAGVTSQKILNCFMSTNVVSGTGILCDPSSPSTDIVFDNVMIVGPSSGTQCFAGFQINSCGDIVIRHCQTIKAGVGLYIVPSTGQVVTALYCTDSFFDSGSGTGVNIAQVSTGQTLLLKFTNVWSCNNANGFVLNGNNTGTNARTEFINCIGSGNGNYGLIINGAGSVDTLVLGGSYSGNVVAGINTATNVGKFIIQNVKIGATAGFGNNGTGLGISTGGDNFIVTGCDLNNNTSSNLSVGTLSGTPGQTFYIHDNIGITTQNQGVVTLTVAGVTTSVTHGLVGTPRIQDVQITNNSAYGTASQFYVSSCNSTRFIITTNANPGAGVTMAWDVRLWGS